VLQQMLEPIRARRKEYEQDIEGVYEILKKGCDVARAEAAETLDMVRRAMKINYFDDKELIARQAEMYKSVK
ncbi:MAG: tryptophan--tRNA ligase, partial [Alistipes sp.]|nr:tryptophan--tRNA ligase [Alistipes sp.]